MCVILLSAGCHGRSSPVAYILSSLRHSLAPVIFSKCHCVYQADGLTLWMGNLLLLCESSQ